MAKTSFGSSAASFLFHSIVCVTRLDNWIKEKVAPAAGRLDGLLLPLYGNEYVICFLQSSIFSPCNLQPAITYTANSSPTTKHSLTSAISSIHFNRPSSDRMDQSSQATASSPPVASRMSSTTHFDKWQLSVLERYGAIVTVRDVDYVCCPILNLCFRPSEMTVVRLVPSAKESRHIAYQFGELDDIEADKRIIGSVGNGLVMYRGIADRFLNGEFIIIPSRYGLQVILLNRIIGICPIPGIQRPYWSLHFKTVDFENNAQPDLRCLHWRYIINLERANNRGWLHIEDTLKWGFPSRVPGNFMRKGIMRYMDLGWGRRGIPNETYFADTIWDGLGAPDAEFDRGIAWTLEQSTRGNRSGSEISHSQSGQSQYTSGTNTVSATNQGLNQPWWMHASTPVPVPGTFGPIGTVPGAA